MNSYRQGDLDGLCGLYSVINASRLVVGEMRLPKSSELFHSCIRKIESKCSLPEVVCYGFGQNIMIALLRDVIMPVLPIRYSRPFCRAKDIPIDEYWTACKNFLDGAQNRAVILSYYTNWDYYLGHWTVVSGASEKRMVLFDSWNRKILVRRHCTTAQHSAEHSTFIVPTPTFFISHR
jgi:hypothetical protein